MSRTKRSGVSLPTLLLLCVACYIGGSVFKHVEVLPDSRQSTLQGSGSQQDIPGIMKLQTAQQNSTTGITRSSSARTSDDESEDESDADSAEEFVEHPDARGDADPDADSADEPTPDQSQVPSYARAGVNATGKYIFPFHADDPTFPGPIEFDDLIYKKTRMLQDRPAVHRGATGTGAYSLIPFQVLSWHPRIVLLPNFMDKKHCELLVKQGEGMAADKASRGFNVDGLMFNVYSDPHRLVNYVQSRMALFTRIPFGYTEWAKMFRYEEDGFRDGYPPNWQTERRYLASIMLFLTDVEEGGQEVFPHEGVDGLSRSLDGADPCKDSSIGYRVTPRMGDALVVWRQTYEGDMDERAVAYTCPVKDGTKWVLVMRFFETLPGDLNMEHRVVTRNL